MLIIGQKHLRRTANHLDIVVNTDTFLSSIFCAFIIFATSKEVSTISISTIKPIIALMINIICQNVILITYSFLMICICQELLAKGSFCLPLSTLVSAQPLPRTLDTFIVALLVLFVKGYLVLLFHLARLLLLGLTLPYPRPQESIPLTVILFYHSFRKKARCNVAQCFSVIFMQSVQNHEFWPLGSKTARPKGKER